MYPRTLFCLFGLRVLGCTRQSLQCKQMKELRRIRFSFSDPEKIKKALKNPGKTCNMHKLSVLKPSRMRRSAQHQHIVKAIMLTSMEAQFNLHEWQTSRKKRLNKPSDRPNGSQVLLWGIRPQINHNANSKYSNPTFYKYRHFEPCGRAL